MNDKKERKEKYTRIIEDYLNSEYDNNQAENRLRRLFVKWLDNKKEHEEKDEVLMDNLLRTSANHSYMSRSRIESMIKRMGFGAIGLEARRRSLTRIGLRVAAVVIPVMIATGIWIGIENGGESGKPFVTQYSAESLTGEWTLADSSDIFVNRGGTVVFNNNGKERIAELTGEAMFKVRKDENRPFIVRAGDITVTVLGTEFNVQAYPDEDMTTITLISGKVSVKTVGNKTYELEPNQQFAYQGSTGEGEVKNIDTYQAADATAWKDNLLVIDGETFGEILTKLKRYYNVKLEIKNSAVLDYVITGKFSLNDSLKEVMECIVGAEPRISYKIEGKTLVIDASKAK